MSTSFYLKCRGCSQEEEVSEEDFWRSGAEIIGDHMAERRAFCADCIKDNRKTLYAQQHKLQHPPFP